MQDASLFEPALPEPRRSQSDGNIVKNKNNDLRIITSDGSVAKTSTSESTSGSPSNSSPLNSNSGPIPTIASAWSFAGGLKSSKSLGALPGKLGNTMFTNDGWKRSKRRTSADVAVDNLLHEVMVKSPQRASSSGQLKDDGHTVREDIDKYDTNFTIFAVEGSFDPNFPLIRFLSPFAISLDRLRMIFAFWSVAYTPVMWSFGPESAGFVDATISHCLEVVADITFLIGSITGFITSVGSSVAGREYVTPKVIWVRRLSSPSFYCDLVSCLPLLFGLFSGQVTHPSDDFLCSLHLLKVLRIHWVLRMPASHFEMQFNTTVQVLRMLAWIVLSTHLIGCLWYYIAVENGVISRHLEDIVDPTGFSHYLVAAKTGAYMVTGKPVRPLCDMELVMIGITSPVGGIFFAFIYGNTTMLLTRMNILMAKHHKQTALIRSTMRTLEIPPDLRHRIARYHHFLAVHHNIAAYTSLMQGLSVNLFIELKAHLFRKMFSQGAFFRDAPGGFLRRLLQEMIEATFCPGDVVIRCGDLGDQMYFVVKGRLDVLSPEGATIGRICENQYFGEIALLVATPRLVSIRAATYCLLAMICRETFLPILEQYPEQKQRMYDAMKSYKSVPAEKDEEGETEDSSDEESPPGSPKSPVHSIPLTVMKETTVSTVNSVPATSGSAWCDKGSLASPQNRKLSLSEGAWHSKDSEDARTAVDSQLPTLTLPPTVRKSLQVQSVQIKKLHSPDCSRRVSALSKVSNSSNVRDGDHSKDRDRGERSMEVKIASKHGTGLSCESHAKHEKHHEKRARGSILGSNLAGLHAIWTPSHSAGLGSRRGSSLDPFSPKRGKPRGSVVNFAVGAPATGTLLHGGHPHSSNAAQLLKDNAKWSMVSDLVMDRIDELQQDIGVHIEQMESRIIKHVDSRCDSPMRELLQESRAMREALERHTRALEASAGRTPVEAERLN